MLKTLAAQVKEFKKDSMLTPVFMIMEVIMEMIIPLMMASIIGTCFTPSVTTGVMPQRSTPGLPTTWWPTRMRREAG